MNALHIQSVINTNEMLKDIFMGVFPADRLPKSIKKISIGIHC